MTTIYTPGTSEKHNAVAYLCGKLQRLQADGAFIERVYLVPENKPNEQFTDNREFYQYAVVFEAYRNR